MNVYLRIYFLSVAFLMMVGSGLLVVDGIPVAIASESGGGGEGHGAEPAGPSYVKLDPLVVPIVNDEGASQVVSLLITLEVMTPDDITKIEMIKPRVKDAMILNMYGLLNQRAAMQNGVLQVGYVKKRLTTAIEKVVGEGVLKDVLLQMVQQNPV